MKINHAMVPDPTVRHAIEIRDTADWPRRLRPRARPRLAVCVVLVYCDPLAETDDARP